MLYFSLDKEIRECYTLNEDKVMEPYIKNNVSARHKTLAGPPIFLAEHNLYVRTYPDECVKILF